MTILGSVVNKNMGAFDFLDIQTKAGLPATGLLKPAYWITQLLPYIFGAAGAILLINIVASGIKIMTSMGDPKSLQGAQAKLTTSVIGVFILFVSFWIVQLLMKLLGITTILFN